MNNSQQADVKIRPDILKHRDEIAKTPILERIANMRESLAAAGDEAQRLRHLPAWASKEMADQGLYRFALPLELGGEDLSAREQIEVVEAVSAIDGSVGWCTQISSEINALVIRRMGLPLVERIFNDMLNNTAGTTGSRMDSPLERQLRDAHQAATHALISYRHYEDLGKTFVGHEPPDGYMELTRA